LAQQRGVDRIELAELGGEFAVELDVAFAMAIAAGLARFVGLKVR
jgi:hypothetical protein